MDIPVFDGKSLIRSAVKYINSMMTCLGTSLNFSVSSVTHPRYFNTLIYLSISPTCSRAASVLTVTYENLEATG